MSTHDVIVIGGGIGGLYASLRCCQAGLSVCTLEKDSRWGGRIRTIHNGNDTYEAGGARFHENHKHLFRLIKRYNIDIVGLDKRSREYRPRLCDPNKSEARMKSPAYKFIKEILESSSQYSASFLRSITFGEFAELVLGATKKEMARLSFGYDGEFDAINAHDGISMFRKDFDTSERYYVCRDGLGALIDKILDELGNTPRFSWEGHLEHRVSKIERKDGVFSIVSTTLDGRKHHMKARAVIAALPKEALQNLYPWNNEQMKMIDTVNEVPCERIYAKYTSPWFAGIRATTTDLPLRQFIPITENIAMISYSDSKHAIGWNQTASLGKESLVTRLHNELRELFPEKSVPKNPLWIEAYFWKDAIHMWKPGVNSLVARKNIQTRLWDSRQDTPFYVCGEAYSSHQCWVNGALESVEQIMPFVKKQAGKKNRMHVKGGSDRESEWKQWIAKKTSNSQKKLGKSDLHELRKMYPDAKWVLFKDRLIDLSQWYYMHPGGQTPYDNHMHKDVYPFFKNIHAHYDSSNGEIKDNVLKKIESLTIARIAL